MATKIYEDNKKWKNDLEKAGFSHLNGDRIICIDCGLTPRLGPGDSPAKLHKGLCKDCKFVKENLREEHLRNMFKAETKESSTKLEETNEDESSAKQAGDSLLYERKSQPDLCTEGIIHSENHDENKAYFAGGYTDKTNNNGRYKSSKYETEKDPIQESMPPQRDSIDTSPGLSYMNRYQELNKKTQCRTCYKSLKNCHVVVVQPCNHVHCQTCVFDQQKCRSCDTPITDQINAFWS